MNTTFKKIAFTLCLSIWFGSSLLAQKFSVSFTSAASAINFTGNVFLYLSKDNKEPKDGMVGLEAEAYCTIKVKNIKPGEIVTFNDSALSYPAILSDLERGTYYVQAVWDKNAGGRAIGASPENIYNKAITCKLSKNYQQLFTINCTELIKEESFIETTYIKEVKAPSALLTAFFKKPITLNVAVMLPKNYYEQPEKKFPVLYYVFGYGGDYHRFSGREKDFSEPLDTTNCIKVILDGNCPLGHSVYANSENNGPIGDALTQELIPLIEKNYRCNGARLLTGHSSGGWTVLWLQTQYPKLFTACWSSSPDPVDFRSFSKVDLYIDKNMFYDKDSTLRSIATVAGHFPWASMKSTYGAEHVIFRGEQMHSFDAVFSQRNSDGSPRTICNEYTGEIDSITVGHWKKYDISLNLKNHWDQLKKDLEGKIRVSVGNQDNFLLNYAVHLMDDETKKLNAGFVFKYYPGDHFTVHNDGYKRAGEKFLEDKYNEFIRKQTTKTGR
jgi:S-formylglutathione hydrolase FrmB